jgi:hypothetical protein
MQTQRRKRINKIKINKNHHPLSKQMEKPIKKMGCKIGHAWPCSEQKKKYGQDTSQTSAANQTNMYKETSQANFKVEKKITRK